MDGCYCEWSYLHQEKLSSFSSHPFLYKYFLRNFFNALSSLDSVLVTDYGGPIELS